MESDRDSEESPTSDCAGVCPTGQCEADWLPGTCDRVRSSLELLLHHCLYQGELKTCFCSYLLFVA